MILLAQSYAFAYILIVLGVLLVPTMFCRLWFSVFGGTSISLEMVDNVSVKHVIDVQGKEVESETLEKPKIVTLRLIAPDDEGAADTVRRMAYEVFSDVLHNVLALPVDVVRVIDSRRARGARATVSCEAETGDGGMVLLASAHDLGQRMSAVHDVSFLSADGTHEHA